MDFDLVEVEKNTESYIKEITEKEMESLLKDEYIDDSQAKYTRVWEISDKEVCLNVFTIPW
jgi:hypothetical protein